MEVLGTLIAGKVAGNVAVAALGELGRQKDRIDAALGKLLSGPEAKPGDMEAGPSLLREILAEHDVTDISPRQFSELLQNLHQGGVLTDQQFQDLSMIRADLDKDGVEPDESLNLIDFYADKVEKLLRERFAPETQDSIGSEQEPLPPVGPIQRRLEWLQKVAVAQSDPQAIGVNAMA